MLEPFKGEGAFFNHLPTNVNKEWTEITKGKCYTSFDKPFYWVVTNPPFRLETGKGRMNAFYFLLRYYVERANKGIAFLANYTCFNTLTPKRMLEINKLGFYIEKIITCNVKKWSNRYYFIIFTKTPNNHFEYLSKSY